jgi:hypothetical protein
MFPLMSLARVVCGALAYASALALGCGERAGDPVVQLPPDARVPALDPGTSGQTGPTGLCGACTSSDECGDANDACVQLQGEHFCGRDCDDQRDCPDGYSCLKLDPGRLWQCVPETRCSPAAAVPDLDEVRRDLRLRINAERLLHEREPLQASSCLDALAQGSALAFARTDEPLGKFVNECEPVWPNCACDWQAEAEVSVARYGLDWATAVELAADTSRDSSARFTRAFLDVEVSEVGIGFWLSGDEAWIALSFH